MAENLPAPLVKICGITNVADAREAARAGADFLGYILFTKSARYIAPPQVRRITDVIRVEFPKVKHVGVFVDASVDAVCSTLQIADLDFAQLHGTETNEYCEKLQQRGVQHIKVFRFGGSATTPAWNAFSSAQYYLCDTYDEKAAGGTGRGFDRSLIPSDFPRERMFLAGGLTPDTVFGAIKELRPLAVDVSSGLEISPGRKDVHMLQRFLANVKASSSM